jgi:ABC-2 type transport system permease protein
MQRNTQLQKYWQVFQITWQNGLAYPISVFFWRLRQFLATFMSLTIWSVLFLGRQTSFGYTQQEMITYIFLVGFLQSIILATILGNLAEDIYQGKISYQLMKPLNIYGFLAAQDLADKLKNFIFVLIETVILFFLFRPVIIFPQLITFLFFLGSALLGAILLFLIMLLFGVIGFWSNDVWGPRFLFYMFIDFTAGRLYPLNILPKLIQNILFFTPFPYFSYVQTQIFLGKFSSYEILRTFLTLGIWILLTSSLFRYLWNKGLREYGALGH